MPKKKKTKTKSKSITKAPLVMGPSCFNKTFQDSRGFQAADLKPKYLSKYTRLLNKYGRKLLVSPTGNPGITLSVAK